MPAAGSHCPYQILAEEFEKLAQSWLRLAEDAERGECIGSPVRMRTVQEYFD
jgi:hypothetical protein